MAYPDLSDLRTRVRTLVNESSSSTFLTDTILNRFLNDGERDVAIKTGCLENIDTAATVAATRLVQFSGIKVKSVEYANVALQKITLKHFGHLWPGTTTPRGWTQWGGAILIEPIPAAANTLTLVVADYPQQEMSSDTDEPVVPSAFHEDIVQYAIFRYHLMDRKYQQASLVYNEYIKSIQTKKAMLAAQQPDTRIISQIPDVVGDKK